MTPSIAVCYQLLAEAMVMQALTDAAGKDYDTAVEAMAWLESDTGRAYCLWCGYDNRVLTARVMRMR